ncbi:MAG: hypothetical protein QXG39_05670 [Candidatus Aenigmatarchaeota archaeon]
MIKLQFLSPTEKKFVRGVVRYIPTLRLPLFLRVRGLFLTVVVMEFLSFCFSTYPDEFYEKISIAGNSLNGVVYHDVGSVVLNPAVANYIDRSCFQAAYTYLGENIMFNSLAYYDKWFGINTSIILAQLYQSGIYVREGILDEGIPTSMNKIFGMISFSQSMYGIDLGGSLKTVYYNIYDTKSNIPLGIDIGVGKKIFEAGSFLRNKLKLFSTVSVNNVLPMKVKIGSETETYQSKLRLSLNLSLSLFPRYNLKKELLLYDTVSVFYDYTGSSHFGLEYRKDKFYFRCGYTPLTFRKLSFGLGMNFSNITLDYAFLPFVNFGIHSLSFTYLWGETKEEKTSDEFEDFLQVQRKVYRIVDKYLRETESLVKDKKYDSALQLVSKLYPLSKEYPKIAELINICKNAQEAQVTNQLYSQYTKYLQEKDFISCYDVVLELVDKMPESNITKQLVDEFNKKEIPTNVAVVITEKRNKFVEKIKTDIEESLTQNDFDQVDVLLKKLQLVSYEENVVQTSYVRKVKTEYLTTLVKKAMQYYKEKNYVYSYFYFYIAKTLDKEDKSISMQIEQVKSKLKKPDLYEELYCKKLFYLSCIHFALSEYQQAKQTFFELRSKYPQFDYSLLLESLRKEKIITLQEILP